MQLTAAMKRCFAAPSIFQNMMLLTLPVGLWSCEAVEFSLSCLKLLKTWSKGGRRVCGKGTTFTVLWTNQTLCLCLLCFATLNAMTAVSEMFNLLNFRSTSQRGEAWPKWPNGKYATDTICSGVLVSLKIVYLTWYDDKSDHWYCRPYNISS